jgi:hypothetical protein
MPRISAISQKTDVPGRARNSRSLVALLLLPIACVALSACGSSHHSPSTSSSATAAAATTTPTTTTPAAPNTNATAEQQAAAFQRRHAKIVAVVNCMHHHGYQLPEPNPKNEVNLHGFPVNSPRYGAAAQICLRFLK